MAVGYDKARILEAYKARGFMGVIRAVNGLNHSDETYLWALAMTAHFGPGNVHSDYTDEHGCPTVEARAKFPRMDYQMDSAKHELEWILGLRRRVVSPDGGTYELVPIDGQ